MPHYLCRAMDPGGKMTSLTIEADSLAEAAAEARARGVTLISVEETGSGPGIGALSPGRFLPVTTKDKVLLFRMLTTLVKSEVTVTEAIRVLYEQTTKMNVKNVLADVLARVEGGSPLSDAMAQHPKVFSEMVVNLVRAGELGGILDTVFERIADFLERRANVRQKLVMSFFYPGVVLVVGIAVVIFMVVFVIPRFMGLIQGQMPPITRFLMDTTVFFRENGLQMILAAGSGAGLLVGMHALPLTRYYLDRYKMKLPVIGQIFRLGIVVAFARTFGMLLESRIPMVEALRATSATLSNSAVRHFLDGAVDRVVAGDPLSAALKESWAFTPITRSLARIGEYSGLMGESMVTVADVHEKLLEDRIARMSAMVEPALILTLGVLVGIVVYGLIAGMLAMYQGSM